jgi:hypothetical protein
MLMNMGTSRSQSEKPKKCLDVKVIRKDTYPTKIYKYKKNLANCSKNNILDLTRVSDIYLV